MPFYFILFFQESSTVLQDLFFQGLVVIYSCMDSAAVPLLLGSCLIVVVIRMGRWRIILTLSCEIRKAILFSLLFWHYSQYYFSSSNIDVYCISIHSNLSDKSGVCFIFFFIHVMTLSHYDLSMMPLSVCYY